MTANFDAAARISVFETGPQPVGLRATSRTKLCRCENVVTALSIPKSAYIHNQKVRKSFARVSALIIIAARAMQVVSAVIIILVSDGI